MGNLTLIQIIEDLKKVKGISNIHLLTKIDKDKIKELEDKNNLGVFECLKRGNLLVLTHDSNFREPVSEIVEKKEDKLIFPGIGFPEVKGKKVVSSSPSEKVHGYLVRKFNMKLKDEATLLIGFNL